MVELFEVHVLRVGAAWRIDSAFDDRDLAMSEARDLRVRPVIAAVRVVLKTAGPMGQPVGRILFYAEGAGSRAATTCPSQPQRDEVHAARILAEPGRIAAAARQHRHTRRRRLVAMILRAALVAGMTILFVGGRLALDIADLP